MNFKEESASQLRNIKIIKNPLCKIFEVDVTKRDAQQADRLSEQESLDLGLIECEGVKFSKATDIQSQGQKNHDGGQIHNWCCQASNKSFKII